MSYIKRGRPTIFRGCSSSHFNILNPYFDDSYAVNSVNVGPYGDSVMQELIPEIEKRFRAIKEPYARILTGGSTGGWEALALQIFHPDFFGGAWGYCLIQ